jgi:hypothetical protein
LLGLRLWRSLLGLFGRGLRFWSVRFVRDEMGVEIGLLGLTRMNMVFLSIITSVRKLQVDAGVQGPVA